MVHDMRVSDVVESVVEDGSEGSVNGTESSTKPIPLFVTEVRGVDI